MDISIASMTAMAGGLTAARHGPPWGGGPPPFVPVIGAAMCLLVLLLIGIAGFFLAKKLCKGRPPWAKWDRSADDSPESPEAAAKRVLAERFAKGDISVEEFMERASALNWTPSDGPEGRK